ncbi:hypothetical protein ACFOGI_05775 [Virgibacillus xinjiangensis]|uniref:Uncharacterized protein n=1 Tax=Virgibacillus xinjiangensis TaxID=393090 RepID=A0ABV7CUD2_9BACI
MKKIIASLALGGILAAGFLFATDNQPTDVAMEMEPTIFSVEKPKSFY